MPPSRSRMNSTSEPEPDSQQQVSARKPKSRPQKPSKPRKIPKVLRGIPGILYYGVRLADIHTVGETPAVIASQSSGPLVSDTSGQHQLLASGPDPEIYSDDAISYPTLPNFPVPFVQNDRCESSSSHTDAFFTENNLGQSYGISNHHQASDTPRPRTDFGMDYDGSCYPHSSPSNDSDSLYSASDIVPALPSSESNFAQSFEVPASAPEIPKYYPEFNAIPSSSSTPFPFSQNDIRSGLEPSSQTDFFSMTNNSGQSYQQTSRDLVFNPLAPKSIFRGYDGDWSFHDPNTQYLLPHFMSPNAQMTVMPTASNDMPYYDETMNLSFPGNFPQDDLAMIDYWSRNDDPT